MSLDVTSRATGDGWDGILDVDEAIVWQGRPDPRLVLRPKHIFTFVFGLFFSGFALVWMILAASAGGFFWAFGLIHFTAGIGVMLGPILGPPWRRRHTWYTLTDKRAFVASDLPFRGRKLTAYEIGPDTAITLTEAGELETVHFAHRWIQTRKGSRRHDVGFERIAEGRVVMALMRKIQESAA